MSNVEVSVLTPVRDGARYLEDAILSVQRDRRSWVEHVVQDGASTDGTCRLLQQYEGSVNAISEQDVGQSDALNRALRRASGRWIAWLNADEFYLPAGLEVLAAACAREKADLVYGDAVLVDGEGRFVRLLGQHRFRPRLLRTYGCYIPSCTMLARRELLESLGWDVALRLTMDWDLYLRSLDIGSQIRYVPYPIAAFRLHEGQVTVRQQGRLQEELAILHDRHGVRQTPARVFGKVWHGIWKLEAGAYRRQMMAHRKLSGVSMAWFRGPHAAEATRLLRSRVY